MMNDKSNDEFRMMNAEIKCNSALRIHTSALNVPQIRFDGFSGDWDQRRLGTVFGKIRNAFVGTATPYYVKEGNFYLESNNVKNGKINRKNEIFINDYFYQKQSDKWLREGDIVMVQSGHVGHTAVIPPELNNIAAHALIMFTDPKEKISPHFLNFQFQTDKIKTKLSEITTGNTIRHILSSEMKEFEVPFTKSEEQTQIGNYFQKLDNLINQHQQKHDKLSSIKKAMLEKMFPKQGETVPEIRFKGFGGEWVEKKLSESIGVIGTGKSVFVANVARTELNKFAILGSTGVIGYERTYDYSGNFILTARVGENAGRLYKHSGDVKITDNTVFIKSDSLDFVFYLLTNFDLRRLAFGTGQPLIKASELNGLKLFFPFDKAEQTAIGNYFQKLDTLINQHQQQIIKLNNIKQACLSKMFV